VQYARKGETPPGVAAAYNVCDNNGQVCLKIHVHAILGGKPFCYKSIISLPDGRPVLTVVNDGTLEYQGLDSSGFRHRPWTVTEVSPSRRHSQPSAVQCTLHFATQF